MSLDFFTLRHELSDKIVRMSDINGVKHGSVIDVIKWVTDVKNPSKKWVDLQKRHPSLKNYVRNYHLKVGQGQTETPMATPRDLIQIILVLSGKNADRIRLNGAEALLNLLDPSQEFIDELQKQHDYCADGDKTHLLTKDDKLISWEKNVDDDTSFYIRIRLPEEYCVETIKDKELTSNVIKFGIAKNVHDRHVNYGVDNGYFIYTFSLHSRGEAKAIEDVLRQYFKSITVYNSFEYVDSLKLAEILKLNMNDTYEKYLELAETFFTYVVDMICYIFPIRYQRQGYKKVLSLSKPSTVQMVIGADGKLIKPFQAFELSLIRQAWKPSKELLEHNKLIRKAESIDVGQDSKEELENNPDANKTMKEEIKQVQETGKRIVQDVDTDNSKPAWRNRYILRDIETGKETIVDKKSDLHRFIGISQNSLSRGYIDHNRQVKGYHIRTAGSKIWVPPENFKFSRNWEENKVNSSSNYIKTRNVTTNEITHYESISVAEKITGITRHTILKHVEQQTEYQGCVWSRCHTTDVGTWIDSPEKKASVERKRSHGKVILKHLQTGEEIVVKSGNYLQANFARILNVDDKINLHTIEDTFLDKPRQIYGYHLRSEQAQRYWQPVDSFQYGHGYVIMRSEKVYIKYTDEEGNDFYYENIQEAARIRGLKREQVQRALSGITKTYGNWSKVKMEEAGNWVDIKQN